MQVNRITFLIFFGSSLFFKSYGQISERIIPLSVVNNLPSITNFTEVSPPDSSFSAQESAGTFANLISVHLNPGNSGEWTETSAGLVWRLGIQSKNAKSIYLSMHYVLLPGVKVFAYDPGFLDFHGAFTSRNNNKAGVLTIAPVRSEKIIVEIDMPVFQKSFGEFEIAKVYHGYSDIFQNTTTKNLKTSEASSCQEDINCSNGVFWQTEKRAVCKIISNGTIGTGTLIGNTSGSSVPYVISASHLISSPENAAEALFLFNYETAGCEGGLATNTGSISGAALVATTVHKLDFALMQLYEKPPPDYQPFYAGWDARNVVPQMGACIHHPFGGPKQIAIEYHPLVNEDIGNGFNPSSTWKVSHWELGTTEPGSSGAALFNEKHRIIGTLTGGRSTCGYPRDDYFTKFAECWQEYQDPSSQLKYWLDPAHTGQLVMDGYDPYGFNASYCDTAWNFSESDRLGLDNDGLQWGWISGHNSEGYTQFAERFEPSSSLQIGGVYLKVAKTRPSSSLANIELKIWDGDEYPRKECYSKLLFLKDLQQNTINYIPLDSAVKMSGPFFVGYKINYDAVSDTFALYHVVNKQDSRPSTMFVFKDRWHQSDDPDAYGIATTLALGISACYGSIKNPSYDYLDVYPNPCTNSITLGIPGKAPIYEVKCFDVNGRSVPVHLVQNEMDNKIYFNLAPGIYHLTIVAREKSFVAKFIVLKE